MKKIFTFLLLAVGFGASAQNLGINTVAPKATLDVVGSANAVATPDGILMPRLTLTELRAKTGYGVAQTGAVVYITDATGTASTATANIGKVGYYRFDGTAWVTMLPKFVGFHATASSNPSAFAAGEIKQIVFSAKTYDTNNWFDLVTGRFTPQLEGYYNITISARVFDNAIKTKNVQLFKNNAVVAIGHTTFINSYVVHLSTVVYMNGTTDYIDARIYSESAATINGTGAPNTYFQADLIGQ
ncbi:hypothetical protein [Pedobacter xixiisoli]|nr:hypothetical protein [Pedobacter xixiisoli]